MGSLGVWIHEAGLAMCGQKTSDLLQIVSKRSTMDQVREKILMRLFFFWVSAGGGGADCE